MASRVRHVRFRTPEVSALLDLFHGLQLEGVRLEPQADGESRNLQPLQAALKNAKALSPLDGPLPAAIDALRLMSDSKLHQNDEETIWQTLSDEGIIMDTVVELLHQLSETETGPLALSAASLYFALLRIPGAFMYRVFSAYAFRICLSAVKKWIYTVAGTIASFSSIRYDISLTLAFCVYRPQAKEEDPWSITERRRQGRRSGRE